MLAQNSPEDFLRSVEHAKVERRRQKEAELALETRPLQPWERYRALVDHYESLQDASEQSDRKTRFALLILGSLNAINVVIAMRGEAIGLPQQSGPLLIGYLICYAMLSLGCCVCAIAALRPRAAGSMAAPDGRARKPLRVPEAVATQTLDEYCENWRTAEVGSLTHELASQVYGIARSNADKLHALHRVYLGLYVLVVLTAALIAVLGWSEMFSR
ncbi:MAG: hypothetical protein ACRD3C_05445 [Vicinamibacterales bacterium]